LNLVFWPSSKDLLGTPDESTKTDRRNQKPGYKGGLVQDLAGNWDDSHWLSLASSHLHVVRRMQKASFHFVTKCAPLPVLFGDQASRLGG
jgi:hypothetical protein